MIRMTLSEYLRKPKDYRGEWTTERWDIPNWKEERKKYMGKRTLMTNVDGATCLVVEGFYCDTLEDMKSLAEIGCEDFYIADCYGFGVYEDLL